MHKKNTKHFSEHFIKNYIQRKCEISIQTSIHTIRSKCVLLEINIGT